MNKSLLPPNSSPLEHAMTLACAPLSDISVPLRTLWDPDTCPVELLPYLAWAFSVDRWSFDWLEQTKREVIKKAYFIHRHKGTVSALRRAVEPLGFLINVIMWWELNEVPGTFRLEVGVLESGITDEMYAELERLIDDAKPCSRHLAGLVISLGSSGPAYIGAAAYLGDEITVYPYLSELISVSGMEFYAGAVHVIDSMRVNP
ncbi:phage tail protein I [Limnobaculum xujianqingii]|uniref:phage tail protein I n=1 Tax=Limnobaculum xujianqingii TaxID=2738837 RepID=UPI0015BA49FF|nr:phage tail protein I [Limnobaculum xujianqingii]